MKLVKYLSILLSILILIAGASTIFAEDENGMGSFLSEDSSSDGGGRFVSDDDSEPVISDDSEDEPDEDDGGLKVKLSKHATANPLLLMVMSLICICVLWFRR